MTALITLPGRWMRRTYTRPCGRAARIFNQMDRLNNVIFKSSISNIFLPEQERFLINTSSSHRLQAHGVTIRSPRWMTRRPQRTPLPHQSCLVALLPSLKFFFAFSPPTQEQDRADLSSLFCILRSASLDSIPRIVRHHGLQLGNHPRWLRPGYDPISVDIRR